jgi:hypothetical protein
MHGFWKIIGGDGIVIPRFRQAGNNTLVSPPGFSFRAKITKLEVAQAPLLPQPRL